MANEIRSDVMLRVIPGVFGVEPLRCDVRPLRGGLEATVAAITFDDGRRRHYAVVKRLEGDARREIPVYRAIGAGDFAPRLLGVAEDGDVSYLFLERVRPMQNWPWRDTANTTLVVRQLARVHELDHTRLGTADWDYEAALLQSAQETVDTAEALKSAIPDVPVGPALRPLRRVAEALPSARQETRERFGTVTIHGDAHPGNVILRERAGKRSAIFLDWGRSRVGSPLEDVSSWLQTLRYWEPAAMQRHDALMRDYLVASGRGASLTPSLREAYWVAGASNVCAGALRYHLVRTSELKGAARAAAAGQARDALRVIRRADACLRGE